MLSPVGESAEGNDALRLRAALAAPAGVAIATGVLMERFGVDQAAAVAFLRRASHGSSRELPLMAAEVAATVRLSEPPTKGDGSSAT